MNTSKYYKVILCSIFAGIFVMTGCRKDTGQSVATEKRRNVNVTVMAVTTGCITQRLELVGDVKPLSTVLLTSKVPGRIERLGIDAEGGKYIPLTEGMEVKKGDILARIDIMTYQTRLKQSQSALAMAEAQLRDAEREEKRMLLLFKDGSVTEQMRDKSVTARTIAEAAFEQAEAVFSLAKIEFDEASPKSPIDGVITRKHIDEGNVISAGMPLVTIESLSQVKIIAGVPERHISSIEPGKTKVRIKTDLNNDNVIDAVVTKVYPSIDPMTRTGNIEILLNNFEGRLRSGAFVHLSLDLACAENVVVIPFSAIVWERQNAYLFVADNGKAHRRQVKVGIREGQRCQIVEGLEPSELLIVSGIRDLRDGDLISIEGKDQQL